MYCSQCAHQIVETDVYCPKCAKPVASFNFNESTVSQVEPIGFDEIPTIVKARTERPVAARHSFGLFGKIIAIAIVALLGFIAIALLSNIKSSDDNGAFGNVPINPSNQKVALANLQTPTPEPPAEPLKTELVNTSFPVPARQIVPIPFGADIPHKLVGGFVTYGGSQDITALVVDEQNYELYRKNYPYRSFYKVDKTDKAKINVTLPSGRYYLIFDNRHSFMTDKSVAAEIYVQYSATTGT